MEEVIKYFESLEARIAALEEAQQTNEAIIASLEAEVEELKNRPAAEPQVVEKVIEKIVEKPVEVIKEVVGETPAAVETPEPVIPMEEPKPEVTPAAPAAPEPVIEEQASPKGRR